MPSPVFTGQQALEQNANDHDPKYLHDYLGLFIQLERQDEAIRKKFIVDTWEILNSTERFVFNKLISGNFRIGVSRQLVINALAKATEQSPAVISHRISGNWDPSTTSFHALIQDEAVNTDDSKPYPFYLAYPLEDEQQSLGEPGEWQAEWKWDGIRGQIIKRNNELFVWSRGEELMTDKFPEYQFLKHELPDGTVLDGEIICIDPAKNILYGNGMHGAPLPFSFLQTRIGRKNLTKKQLLEAPVGFIAYDVLEFASKDLREKSLSERRTLLSTIPALMHTSVLNISPAIPFSSWEELSEVRQQSRDNRSEGIVLKRKSSPYQSGRKRGDWWKWKIDPLTIDAVMIYAQKGSGRRSNHYTFAVRDGDKLVSFAKAYGGLTDKEFALVDAFIKRNSIEKFGPVRTVKPELVFLKLLLKG